LLKNPITAIINPTGIKRKDAHIIPMYISSKPARIIIAIPKSIKLLPNIIFFIMLFLHNFRVVELFLLSILSDIAYRFHSFMAQNTPFTNHLAM